MVGHGNIELEAWFPLRNYSSAAQRAWFLQSYLYYLKQSVGRMFVFIISLTSQILLGGHKTYWLGFLWMGGLWGGPVTLGHNPCN